METQRIKDLLKGNISWADITTKNGEEFGSCIEEISFSKTSVLLTDITHKMKSTGNRGNRRRVSTDKVDTKEVTEIPFEEIRTIKLKECGDE